MALRSTRFVTPVRHEARCMKASASRLRCLLFLMAAFSSACITPPVLQWYDGLPLTLSEAGYPEPHEFVALRVSANDSLRGVFVSAGDGAPVVMHLLGSSSSVLGTYHYREGLLRAPAVARSLQRAGFSSLFIDYRGVGVSDGERSPDHFASDVRHVFAEATRRAGTASHVFVRSTSIGTLPALLLVREGHAFGGIVLIAPVRNESVVEHYAYQNYASLIAFFGSMWYSEPVDLDTEKALASARTPVLVLSPPNDHFLPPQERERLQATVAAVGGEWVTLGTHHADLCLAARDLLPAELDFLQSRLASK